MYMTNQDFQTIDSALNLAGLMLDPNEPFLVEAKGVLAGLSNKKEHDNGRQREYLSTKRKENKRYGRSPIRLSQLSRTRLKRLREDIVLCSLCESDYKNRYDIDPKQVLMFFEGYVDYIENGLMKADGIPDSKFFDALDKYDTIDNLYNWHGIVFCN